MGSKKVDNYKPIDVVGRENHIVVVTQWDDKGNRSGQMYDKATNATWNVNAAGVADSKRCDGMSKTIKDNI